MIPYGHQSINQDDIKALTDVARSDWLTQGPNIEAFEKALAAYCGSRYAVVTCNGTAALHAAYYAVGIGSGDECITSPITFPATSNAALWQGALPVFADVDESGNIDPERVASAITGKTKVLVPVDYTGRPAALDRINELAEKHGLVVIEDACQALGASFRGKKIGSISDLTVFSFHPVKSITTGEGGAVLTNDEGYYRKVKSFVTHGIVKDNFELQPHGDWYFEMQALGQNYRITDMQCALGMSQLRRIEEFIERRRLIANRYYEALRDVTALALPPHDSDEVQSAWHLYVVRVDEEHVAQKPHIFKMLRAADVGVQVHHIPVYLHPYYRRLGYRAGECPRAESFYAAALSLPIYPDLSEADQGRVVSELTNLFTTL